MAEVPRIKVCGIRTLADLPLEITGKLDAIGFVDHAPSVRHVAREDAARVLAELPPGILGVAVMVDPTPTHAEAWIAAAGAHAVQLCGDEEPDDWRDFRFEVLRRIGVATGCEEELARWSGIAAGFVLDHPAAPGGTGRGVDVGLAAALASKAPCLLAGGLDPDNVAERVHSVRPHGVDASSRLEARPGRKDPALVARFVEHADAALTRIQT